MTEDKPESLPRIPKRRSGLPILAVFVAVVAGGAGFLYYRMTRPDPFKVLVYSALR